MVMIRISQKGWKNLKKVFLAVLMFVMGIAFLLPTMNHANAQSNGEITWGEGNDRRIQ
jgi:hypothetical protein